MGLTGGLKQKGFLPQRARRKDLILGPRKNQSVHRSKGWAVIFTDVGVMIHPRAALAAVKAAFIHP
jgi:hypothetical protein